MSEKISEYTTSVTALASGDLMDVSKLISTSPDVYQSQKLNYSVLLTELSADISITYLNIGAMSSANLASIISDETGTGSLVFANTPTLITPSLGAATATSINGNIFNGAINSTWSLSNNKTFSVGASISFLGTDGTTFTFPSGDGTIARLSDIPASSNLGSANLTSTDDARTFTLKSGGTASQNLQFLNSGGGNLLKLSGNKAIDFGSGTHTINPKFYLNGDIYQYFSIYNKTNANSFCDIYATAYYANGVFDLKNAAGNTKILMNAGSGSVYTETAIMNLFGIYSSYRIYNSTGTNVVNLCSGNTNNGEFYLSNSSGTYKVQIAVGGSVIDTNLKVGGSFASATAALQVVGGGSTSATTTALFQNSASVAALKVKDDLYCIFRAKDAAIPDGDLSNNELSFYIEEATNDLHFKVKFSTGTVKSGKINLT